MSLNIHTPTDLKIWLSGKPKDWGQAIALRAALRALPLIVYSSSGWLEKFAQLPVGAVMSGWAQLTDHSIDVLKAGSRANARFAGQLFDFDLYKSEPLAAMAADASYHSADAQTQSIHVVNDCVTGVGLAAEAFRSGPVLASEGKEDADTFWHNVEIDCQRLAKSTSAAAAEALAVWPLWTSHKGGWLDTWKHLTNRLTSIDSNYSELIDWYHRRLDGERAAFDIPGDKGRKEDKAILRRLAEATDEDFWGKGHEYVNATLKGWLDEARARVAPPPIVGEASGTAETSGSMTAELGPLPPPPQNRNVLSFKASTEGRIEIDAAALADQLRLDQAARDRHAEAVREALAALQRCQGNNAAARLSGLFQNYIDAAGDGLESAKPSLAVQRGERLRQELARYESADHMLSPIADDLLLDVKGWQTAHNMWVGLDPVLMAMDVAMLGPDRQPALIPPEEIREKVQQADDAELLAEGVAEIVTEAANLAPEVPDANNRRTLWSVEVARNLFIEVICIALNPSNAEAQTAVFNAKAGVRALCGSIEHAKYIVEHREWILQNLGSTPTLRELIERLADRLERVTPFKPN
jgi:hypothetical protein